MSGKTLGYTAARKTAKLERLGDPDPDRDVQFVIYIQETKNSLKEGIHCHFVDTRKKKNIAYFQK